MKILLVTNFVEGAGGISGQVELLAQCIKNDGHQVGIFSTKGSLLTRLLFFYKLKKVAVNYDILHVHCCSFVGFYSAILGVTIAMRLRKRIICTYHGGGAERFFKKYSWLVKHYLNKTDGNIVLSGFLAKIFEQYGIKHQIIPNILKADESHYRLRKHVSPSFISVRTLQPLYNIQCIVRAFAIVKQSKSNAVLYILSDGACRKELEQMTRDLNLTDVHFIGRVPNAQVYEYLDKADVFVSMPKIDNQPMSILEAFKCGLLVISSCVGGVPYMVDNGRTGILVESNNHVQLARKMLDAMDNPHKTIEMMQAGHEELRKYRWEYIKEKLYALYLGN